MEIIATAWPADRTVAHAPRSFRDHQVDHGEPVMARQTRVSILRQNHRASSGGPISNWPSPACCMCASDVHPGLLSGRAIRLRTEGKTPRQNGRSHPDSPIRWMRTPSSSPVGLGNCARSPHRGHGRNSHNANCTPVLPKVRRPTNHAVSSWARRSVTRMSVNVANARLSPACTRLIGESR